jgi:hypothetical protein
MFVTIMRQKTRQTAMLEIIVSLSLEKQFITATCDLL